MSAQVEASSRDAREIAYSCIFTIVLCLSYCVRPNISSSSTSWRKAMWRKLYIIFWMIITPEAIIEWALRQLYHANRIAKTYRERGWTLSHGFFTVMGGLLLYKGNVPVQVLSPAKFASLVDNGCIAFPSITEADVRKGKNHPVFGGIVLIQVLWFVVQCIARGVQGFAITQLEMVTLVFIVANAMLLSVWWYKPQDANGCIRLDLIALLPESPIPVFYNQPTSDIYGDFLREKALSRLFKTTIRQETLRIKPKDTHVFWGILLAPLALLAKLFTDYVYLIKPRDIPDGAIEVPRFYGPDTSNPIIFWTSTILGGFFAASHISMWFSHFPTYRDKMVWRISSMVCVSLPVWCFVWIIFGFLIMVIVSAFFSHQVASEALKIFRVASGVVSSIAFIAMIIARLSLLLEAFICLSSLAPSARMTVPWTNYIPHIS